MKKIYILFSFILAIVIIVAIVTGGHENIGNPTVKEILKGDPEADLIKLDGLVYTPFDSKDKMDYSKGSLIGETNQTWWKGNLYATKLLKGTEVYTTTGDDYKKGNAPFVIIVESDNEMIVYNALVEG